MAHDPLLTTLLDLDAALESQELTIGGGYGLYLKQLYLKRNPQTRTLFHPSALPSARTTADIDLILRAEVVTDSTSMKAIRDALDALGFIVVATAKYTQFVRDMQPGQVKIDLLAGPLGEFANRGRRTPGVSSLVPLWACTPAGLKKPWLSILKRCAFPSQEYSPRVKLTSRTC